MNKTVLVTGASGFVGTNLCRTLIGQGYKVLALVRGDHNREMLEEMGAERIVCQITDTECIRAALKRADYVIDVMGRAWDWGTYESFVVPNIIGVKNILDESMRAGIKKFVHISTVAVHGFGNHIDTDEEGPYFPTEFPYCLTKHEGEKCVLNAYKEHSFPVSVIRPANVYGENDTVTILNMADALRTRSLPHVDSGRRLTCPVYVGNLVDAIIAAMEKDEAVGEVFIISDGLRITWREWTEKLCAALEVKPHWLSVPGAIARFIGSSMELLYRLANSQEGPPLTRYRTQQVSSNYHFSIEKAKNVLGWKPETGIDAAVERTIEWYKKERSK
jgi:nucleoside-diphosphate-sugar epimerase